MLSVRIFVLNFKNERHHIAVLYKERTYVDDTNR